MSVEYELLDGATGSTTGDTNYIQNPQDREYVLVQCEIDSGSVVVQGRLSDDYSWVDLYTFTSNDIVPMASCPQMRANSVSVTSASVLVRV